LFANLRVLEIEQVKTVPYVPISHPRVEGLIGTIWRELLDRTFFWNGARAVRRSVLSTPTRQVGPCAT
jgi:hypothetical protein